MWDSANSRWAPSVLQTKIGDAAPSSPLNGNLWWDSSTGRLKIYYEDIDSSQWVDAFTATGSVTTSVATTMPLTLIKTLTANYTTVTADHGYYIRIDTTNNVTVTLVSDSTESIPIGTTMIIGKLNTGSVTISAGS